MKKTLFAILAVLFTIALIATCDVFEPVLDVVEEVPQFTPDGRPMVRVTIDLGDGDTSRALIAENAKTDSKEYEVVFLDQRDNTTTYRLFFANTVSTVMTIPVDTYPTAHDAIVFAGTNKTLLGVGGISSGSSITGINDVVVFRIIPLSGTVSSSFSLTGHPLTADTDLSLDVFEVPLSDNIVGKYNIGSGVLANAAGIIQNGDWHTTLIQASGTDIGKDYDPFYGSGTLSGSFASGVALTSADIAFTLNTNFSKGGYAKAFIEAPVVAIKTDGPYTGSTPVNDWKIKGGLENETLDNGVNKGGAALIKIGIPLIAQLHVPVIIEIE